MSTKSNQPDESHCTQVIQTHLETFGWIPCDGVAIASRTFRTAVGPKVALVFLVNYGEHTESYHLTGEYQSEGQNILESQFVMLPKKASDDELRALAKVFATNAAKTIAQSYAARLVFGEFIPGEFRKGPNGMPAICWWRNGEPKRGEAEIVYDVREYPDDLKRLAALEATST